MSDSKYKPPQISYREFRLYDVLSVGTIADMLATHKLAGNEYVDKPDYDLRKSKFKTKIMGILDNNISLEGSPLKEYRVKQEWVNEYGEVESSIIRCIKLSEFIAFADSKELAYPPEIVVNNTKSSEAPEIPAVETMPDSKEVELDDVMSNEAINELKKLPLPRLKQKVVMLATEREKWDNSIMAAANIGILFYEEGLVKPTTMELFVSEYKKHLEKFPDLPVTAIEKIYKHLPDGYGYPKSGGRPAKDKSKGVDLNPIIKAAVYAGSLAHARVSMNITSLKKGLRLEQYSLPSDDVLENIINTVMNLDL